jgi:Trypsin
MEATEVVPPMQIISTRNATKHEYYEKDTLMNDIAIIVLPSDVSGQGGCSQTIFFTDEIFCVCLHFNGFYLDVAPIRLPARSQVGETFADQTGRVSGWGRTKDRKCGLGSAVSFVLDYINLFNMLP